MRSNNIINSQYFKLHNQTPMALLFEITSEVIWYYHYQSLLQKYISETPSSVELVDFLFISVSNLESSSMIGPIVVLTNCDLVGVLVIYKIIHHLRIQYVLDISSEVRLYNGAEPCDRDLFSLLEPIIKIDL